MYLCTIYLEIEKEMMLMVFDFSEGDVDEIEDLRMQCLIMNDET